ncbi:4-hydroxybenzoate octaprenyltransferase [Cryptosporidium andersoni]|uniref:4-hydroxybenzoate polyprenyltransferase, mitochondrial n=1 Tax=Cryptosporidium andersoni TaxID=117008 RepID=A0A1J4MQV4_9CRYT|nr:4-hydroxybenzoate octaprenyltransferase [Cryptosporidium andersoni]
MNKYIIQKYIQTQISGRNYISKYLNKRNVNTPILTQLNTKVLGINVTQKMQPYIKLFRLQQRTGYWLLYIPTTWSIAMASSTWIPNLKLLGLFSIGSFAMRSSGCIINDIIDRNIDSKVERTKTRPLACKELSLLKASIFLSGSIALSYKILTQLNTYTIYLALPSVVMVPLYPLMKRITHYPQLFLGLTFNWGVLLGWTSVYGCLNPFPYSFISPIALYLAAACWSVHYDTIYAHQDKLYDKQVGVYSTALHWGDNTRDILNKNSLLLGLLLLTAGIANNMQITYYCSVLMFVKSLLYQSKQVNFNSPEQCQNAFSQNKYLSTILLFGILTSKYLSSKNNSNETLNIE